MSASPAISPKTETYFFVGLGGMGMAPLALYLKSAGHTVRGCDDHPREEVAKLLSDNHIPLLPTSASPQGAAFSETPSKPSGEACHSPGSSSEISNLKFQIFSIPADTTRVVFSSAVPPTHPVRLAAEQRGLPILRRGQLLAEISTRHRLVAVVGSHGKTTTTALLVSALKTQNFPASHVLGGLFQTSGPSPIGPISPISPIASDLHLSLHPAAFDARSPWLIAEVDESDGTIESFAPEITLVVNFDWDHPDQYRTAADLEAAFARLFARTRGTVIIPAGDPTLERLSSHAPRLLRYGPFGDLQLLSHQPLPNGQELHIECKMDYHQGAAFSETPSKSPDEAAHFTASPLPLFPSSPLPASPKSRIKNQESRISVTVPVTGPFNRHNALAALAASLLITGTLPPPDALAHFPGVRRRQNILFDRPGLTVLEDYAHHPAEIGALLDYARERWPDRRLVTVFQPHRYTRTRQYRAEFAAVLDRADVVVLKETYAASEKPLEGGRAADILALMRHPDASLVPDLVTLISALSRGVSHSPIGPICPISPIAQSGDGGNAAAAPTASPHQESRIKNQESPASTVLFIGAGDIEEWGHAYAQHLAGRETWWTSLRASLSPETVLERDAPLGSRTTIGVGGHAAFYAEPATEADLAHLLQTSMMFDVGCMKENTKAVESSTAFTSHFTNHTSHIASACIAASASPPLLFSPSPLPVFLLGRGSNLIVPDSGYPGLVIRLCSPAFTRLENLGSGRIRAGAGVSLKRLNAFATQEGISGFEFLEGIPGTVGGSLRMNAGAMGGWIFDVVSEIRLMTRHGEVHQLPRDRFHVEYRSCSELQDAVALSALLAGETASPETIRARTAELASKRKASQPRDASAGCAFKNPVGDSAGRLIDSLGLKGRRIGQAEVSPIHANFIVNRGDATASDVIRLINEVRTEVLTRTGIALEPEVLLLGHAWEETLDAELKIKN